MHRLAATYRPHTISPRRRSVAPGSLDTVIGVACMQLHLRHSKGGGERYVPLSSRLPCGRAGSISPAARAARTARCSVTGSTRVCRCGAPARAHRVFPCDDRPAAAHGLASPHAPGTGTRPSPPRRRRRCCTCRAVALTGGPRDGTVAPPRASSPASRVLDAPALRPLAPPPCLARLAGGSVQRWFPEASRRPPDASASRGSSWGGRADFLDRHARVD